jgi:hypothetical protein
VQGARGGRPRGQDGACLGEGEEVGCLSEGGAGPRVRALAAACCTRWWRACGASGRQPDTGQNTAREPEELSPLNNWRDRISGSLSEQSCTDLW